jgi:hypothetical protein
MKQSDDENIITLDDGRQFKAELGDGCEGCCFNDYPFEIPCYKVRCQAIMRKDYKEVIFVRVEK